jgi:hypothetical protein
VNRLLLLDSRIHRFGRAYLDFRDSQRIIKDSGHWYGKLARLQQSQHKRDLRAGQPLDPYPTA